MMPVGPFFAHLARCRPGPSSWSSSSWQIAMNACSGVIDLVPYSLLFALSSTCLPRAASLTRSRKRLTTRNSTSPSSSDSRTSRSASSMTSSVSSATPVSRWRAARNPLARVSSTSGSYSTLGRRLVDDEVVERGVQVLDVDPDLAGPAPRGAAASTVGDGQRASCTRAGRAVGEPERAGIAEDRGYAVGRAGLMPYGSTNICDLGVAVARGCSGCRTRRSDSPRTPVLPLWATTSTERYVTRCRCDAVDVVVGLDPAVPRVIGRRAAALTATAVELAAGNVTPVIECPSRSAGALKPSNSAIFVVRGRIGIARVADAVGRGLGRVGLGRVRGRRAVVARVADLSASSSYCAAFADAGQLSVTSSTPSPSRSPACRRSARRRRGCRSRRRRHCRVLARAGRRRADERRSGRRPSLHGAPAGGVRAVAAGQQNEDGQPAHPASVPPLAAARPRDRANLGDPGSPESRSRMAVHRARGGRRTQAARATAHGSRDRRSRERWSSTMSSPTSGNAHSSACAIARRRSESSESAQVEARCVASSGCCFPSVYAS